ncbi:MAG: hypothetical protein Q9220_000098 [cf. Caloplaca sp. 1 TL-2023]
MSSSNSTAGLDPATRQKINQALSDQKTMQSLTDAGKAAQAARNYGDQKPVRAPVGSQNNGSGSGSGSSGGGGGSK